jgi:hypothetical protein
VHTQVFNFQKSGKIPELHSTRIQLAEDSAGDSPMTQKGSIHRGHDRVGHTTLTSKFQRYRAPSRSAGDPAESAAFSKKNSELILFCSSNLRTMNDNYLIKAPFFSTCLLSGNI